MTADVFVDSTTLIYTLDKTNLNKKARSAAWLKTLRDQDRLVVSPQVLNESYWVVLRKPEFTDVRPMIRMYLRDHQTWTTAQLTAETTSEAFKLEDRFGVRFWDALLLASANDAGCRLFLSEDLNDGQVYGSVQVVNPFRHSPADVLGAAAPS